MTQFQKLIVQSLYVKHIGIASDLQLRGPMNADQRSNLRYRRRRVGYYASLLHTSYHFQ